ncbi:enoyl-CoA hydratase/isomerase family protein [Ancylobacter sp. IITR112]|uniref:enoyl-CoA hydratase/isomerase family protein n=1 Tax=Ancylobacter sp. IITR112 TaxID=3138073 RepID=UPI00352A442E
MSTTAPAEGRVHLTRAGAVARLVFDRPAARNAMTWRMYEEMAQACTTLAADPTIRVVVLRGAGGKAFVAGTDIEQFRAFASGEDGIAYEAKVEHYMGLLEQLPVPTVAVVEGWAVGGGMAIANACDFRLATPGARFGVPIARTLGNCLSAANVQRLVATLGLGMVRRMLLAAETPMAEEMPDGYVAIHPAEELDAAVEALCGRLAGNAPLTLRTSKQMLLRLAHDPRPDDADLVQAVYGSADFREGVEAFLAKRPAQWRGE